MRVLIVEDEIRLAESIQEILKENKISADIVTDGIDGFDYATSPDYDVILLDIMLPGFSGFDIISKLREEKIETPVIFLTAKDSIDNKIKGLNKGADDYLTKPFNPQELIARIKAVSRRKGEIILDEIVFGDLVLNTDNHSISAHDKTLHLGMKEYELMELFMSFPKQIFSKEQLISKIWGFDSDAMDNNVEAYISFLRKKLNYLQSTVTIQTIRKVGYHLSND